MMRKYLFQICCLAALLATGSSMSAQNLSNKGIDFWVGYGHHQFMEAGQTNTQEMVIYLSSEQAANVRVAIEGTAWVQNYVVPANSVIATAYIPKAGAIDARLISLPCTFVPPGSPCGGEGVFANKGIHITSDVPIVAYAHIFGSASSGATMLMPVETWGYGYITLNSEQSYAANCFSWAYVIAQNDNTLVEVIPAAVTRTGKPAGVPFTILLNRGEIYQTMAGPETGSIKPQMTGTKFKSIANAMGDCYPIAVFAGSSRTTNPAACGSSGGDNDNQQCFPSQAWGKRYLTAPTSNSVTASTPMINTYKIAVKDPTTIVKRNGVQLPLASLINGTYYKFESSTADYIESDKSVMVAQFMTGGPGCMGGGGVGDPEMMYISPIEQGIKRIGFYRNTRESITTNYLTLIIPTAGVPSLRIDGSAAFTHTYVHPNLPGYTVVIRRWTSAQAQAIAFSDSAFTAITYGLGSVESYGYNAGTLINNLSAVGSIFNVSDTSTTTTSHSFTCTKTPVKLSVLLGYPTPPTRLVWRISLVGGGILPNVDVIDNAPVPVGTMVVNGISYFKFDLPGTYTFASTGNFRIPILATHPTIENCSNTEEVYYYIEVKGKPVADFSFVHSGCVLDAVQFNGQSVSSNGFNINQWMWTYPDATTASIQNPIKLFATPGIKAVNIRIVSSEGCVSDTTKNVGISDKPLVDFTTTPAAVCTGTAITFNDASTYTGTTPISISYWNFGDLASGAANTSTLTNPTHIFSTYGVFTIKHTAGLGASCMGDTITKTVRVYAAPTTTFSYPAGCLPASGTVQFNSAASTPDGQAITGHLWNFGDPASGAANTSTLANPSHTYPGFGNYTITYTVTTVNGCTKDTVVNATMNLAPTFSYPALAAVCENTTAAVSVATATITNGVPGAGVYNGPATSLAGSFNPALAGPGNHTIWYVYTTTANCKDSVSQTIRVHPKPNASFAIPAAGCLPTTGLVNFNYTGTAIAGQTYLWNFGDPGSGAANTSTLANPTHNYATGNFTITLTVTTTNSCVKDSVVTQAFNIKAALSYPALPAVCESVPGTVSVATAVVTNGATGTGVYSGTATDALGNFNPSLAGPGNHIIKYVFTATGNCKDSITQTILVHAKPNASYTYPTAACLPTTGFAQFTYNGSMSAGQTYAWNFGDPASGVNNTSTLQSPSHNYTNTGTYPVIVTVTNTNSCVDDTLINIVFSVMPALSYPALAAVCESVIGTISVATATVTNGVLGTGVYSGTAVNATGDFNPSLAGPGNYTITYTFTSTGNCEATATQTIRVNAKPNASYTYPTAACLPTTGFAQFTYNGSMSAGQTYAWNFGDPASGANNTSTLQSPSHNYTNTGTYPVIVTVTNTNGCVDDTLINIVFSVMPALSYPALASVCESVTGTISVATATVTNGVLGSGVYSGTAVNAAGNFNPSLAGPGNHTITYTFTSTGNCVATTTQTILVHSKPLASYTYPTAACLPTTGFAQFTYNGSMSAGQTYAWNFGDPASGVNNTSTLQSPSHTYTNTGTYPVIVTVTNTNGCVDDTLINIVFSVMPALNYPALAAVCASVTGTVSVATATVTNAVLGTGVYSGTAVNAAGNFNPSLAGPGNHTITYTFTSAGNCVATTTQTILVHPKPTAAFGVPVNVCLGQQALITDNSGVSSGTISTWNWIFGNGNTASYNNGNPFNVLYATFGFFKVKLVTISNNGCISDSAFGTVKVSDVPFSNFILPESVCMPGGTATFINNSSVRDGTTLTYSWNFGDLSAPSTASSPGHVYATIGTYQVTLTATSSSGCFKDSTQSFSAFFDKPKALFDVNPSVLCQGKDNIFTNNSTAPNSSIRSSLWVFGDGTTSTEMNPVKRFSKPGVYNVRLIVTNMVNCVSDTFSRTVTVILQPVIDAGPSFVVPQGTRVEFKPVVNDVTVTSFLWTPPTGLSNPAVLKPVLYPDRDQIYTLTATTGGGLCTASDILTVKILRPVKIPNAFSPNGDNINDTWILENLADYPGAVVEVFNRYGQNVYTSAGYSIPWDGTVKGKPLPVATYYYIIQLKNGFKPLNGSVTIIR